ncbi:MAG: hypothetical protein LBT92_00715 [Rickettsiales bacterium]|jgi:hypothetical protein|nr:hypothetical protein [Rickettsiales bacterium]
MGEKKEEKTPGWNLLKFCLMCVLFLNLFGAGIAAVNNLRGSVNMAQMGQDIGISAANDSRGE